MVHTPRAVKKAARRLTTPRPRPTLLLTGTLLLCGLAVAPSARAGTYNWQGGDHNWYDTYQVGSSTFNYWNTYPTSPGQQDTAAVVNNTTTGTITLSSNATINSFLSNGGFNLTGGTLFGNLANAAGTIQVNNTFNLNGGGISNFTVNAGSGGQGITVSSNGNNFLSGDILNATLTFGAGAYAAAYNASAVNGTLAMAGGDLRLVSSGGTNASVALSQTGTLSGYGAVDQGNSGNTLANSGTVNANVSGQTLTLGVGNITGSGTFEATGGGTLAIGSGGLLNAGAGSAFLAQTGTVQVNGGGLGGTVGTTMGSGISFSGNGNNYITGTTVGGPATLTFGAGAYAAAYNASAVNGTLAMAGGDLRLVSSGGTNASVALSQTGTLSGYGAVDQGNSGNTLANSGTVNANVSGQTLTLGVGNITGSGTFEATGGGTLAIGSGGLLNAGAGSAFLAQTGTVQVNGGGLGGTVGTTMGSGISFSGNGNNYITGTTVGGPATLTFGAGAYAAAYNASAVNGTLAMAGGDLRLVSSGGTNASVALSQTGTLSGYGAVDQGNSGNTLANSGTVNANVSGQTLTLGVGNITGSGTFEATGGGTLAIGSGGLLNAGAGSAFLAQTGTVQVNGGGLGGTVGTTMGSGISFSGNGNNYITGTTVGGPATLTFGAGAYAAAYNASAVNGTLAMAGGDLRLVSSGGTNASVALSQTGTLSGYGAVDQGNSGNTLANSGTINARGSAQTLTINVSNFQNNGTTEVSQGATLSDGSGTTNAGTVLVDGGGTLVLNSGMTQTAGQTRVDGTTNLKDQTLALQGGTLSGTGAITGSGSVVQTSGVVKPGDSPGTLTISGSFNGSGGGVLSIEYTASSNTSIPVGAGLLAVGGTVALGGQRLDVSFLGPQSPGGAFLATAGERGTSFNFLNFSTTLTGPNGSVTPTNLASLFTNETGNAQTGFFVPGIPQNAAGGVIPLYQLTDIPGGSGGGALHLSLTNAAAPEPSQTVALGLGILSLVGLGWRARRRGTPDVIQPA